jgi:hypothetical protein
MSAFLCNNDLFDLLSSTVTWGDRHDGEIRVVIDSSVEIPEACKSLATTYGDITIVTFRHFDTQILKNVLVMQNYISLNARYGDSIEHEPIPFRFISQDFPNSLATVLGAVACYGYQACEDDGWRNSFAKAVTDAIQDKICRIISAGYWDFARNSVTPSVVKLSTLIK